MDDNIKNNTTEEGQIFKADLRPSIPAKIIKLLADKQSTLSFLCFGLGILWVFLFPAVTITTGELKVRGTYFSENALLARSTSSEINDQHIPMVGILHEQIQQLHSLKKSGCQDDCNSMIKYLQRIIENEKAFEVYQHDYQDFSGNGGPRNRTNLYVILRATAGTDGKESIVLVSHYSTVGKGATASSVSVGLAMLHYLKDVHWLAKDVILLISADGEDNGRSGFSPGVQAWLQDYHSNNAIHGFVHAGIIRAAIVLDLQTSSSMNTVAILSVGHNGQLPNLDLINTAVSAFAHEKVHVLLDRCDEFNPDCKDRLLEIINKLERFIGTLLQTKYLKKVGEYFKMLRGLFRFMKALAIGSNGPHADFISYNIDCISLCGIHSNNPKIPRPLDTKSFMKATESIIRSISNLEEKLHQSFYFYMLPDIKHFVSIGEYYYSLVMVLLPSISLLLKITNKTGGLRLALGIFTILLLLLMGTLLISSSLVLSKHIENIKRVLPALNLSSDMILMVWCLMFTTIIEICCVFFVLPRLCTKSIFRGNQEETKWFNEREKYLAKMENEKAFKCGIMLRADSQKEEKLGNEHVSTEPGWKAIKCSMLILIMFAHCTIGIVNYPFALIGAIMTMPFSLITPFGEMRSTCLRSLSVSWLIFSSPFMIMMMMQLFFSFNAFATLLQKFSLMGYIGLPYLCFVYFPIHVLSSFVFIYRG